MADPLILVTGASGFIGGHLVAGLLAAGCRVRIAQRRAGPAAAGAEVIVTGDLAQPVDWTAALAGVRHVVHLAGLAHAGPGLPEALYDRVNTQATLDLARAAEAAGVTRFVYLSSIKAQTGASSGPPVSETDPPTPDQAYGRSKLAAEQGLAALDLDWVALRPVLVYGRGVKANMAALLRLARLPVPLPLGALTAPRSVLAVENLVAAILFALKPACPPRRAFIVADPEPIGVAGIVAAFRRGLGRPPHLIAIPSGLLRAAAALIGQSRRYALLADGLVAPPAALLRAGWRPVVETKAALARLAAPVPPAAPEPVAASAGET